MKKFLASILVCTVILTFFSTVFCFADESFSTDNLVDKLPESGIYLNIDFQKRENLYIAKTLSLLIYFESFLIFIPKYKFATATFLADIYTIAFAFIAKRSSLKTYF